MARLYTNGGSLDIAGSTQRCSWGNILLTTNPITAAFLFKLRASGSSSYDVVWGHSNASWFFILNGAAGSERKLAFNFQSSGGEKTSGYLTDNLSLDTWYVAIGRHDSGGGADNTKLRVYTASDGVLVEEKTATNAFSISTTANSLAAGYDLIRSLPVNARFKKFSVWNRTLSDDECDDFASGVFVSKASMLLETNCDEAEGTTLKDTSTLLNPRPATLSGNATTHPDVPAPFARTARNTATNRVQTFQNIQTDTFTRADSASNLGSTSQGQAWVQAGGVWGISSNKAVHNTDGGVNGNLATIDPGVGNLSTLEAVITVPVNGNAGLAFRFIDVNNHLGIRIADSSNNLILFKVVSGTPTTLGTYSTAINTATNYTIKASFTNDVIRVYFGGVLVIAYTLTAGEYASFPTSLTKVALRVGSSVTGCTFDNFVAKYPDDVRVLNN